MILAAIFVFGSVQGSRAEPPAISDSCKDKFQEYTDYDEYYKSFAYSFRDKESVCGFGADEDTAVKNCEEARTDNNYLSYYSKTILPPCKVYASSPAKNGSDVVWNEAAFSAASEKFFAARETKKKSGDDLDLLLQELPMFMYREKMRNYVLDHRDEKHWAIAATPKHCMSNWHIYWNKSDEEELKERVVQRCNASFAKRSTDWKKFTNTKCECKLVMLDGKIMLAKESLPGLLTTAVSLYIEQGGQKVTLRGLLEYEISKLKPQIIKFKNKDGQVVCGGGMNPSLGDDGGFKMTCKGLGFTASGITQVITSGKTHSIGSGKTDQGGRFVFVTALMPDELAEKYPDYFGAK